MPESTFLRDISLIWSLFHVLILFITFYESRYSKGKTLKLTAIFMGGMLVLFSALIFIKGALWVSQMVLVICTLPSLVFFYVMSSQRDGRFVFTFCLVDTASLWLIVLTMLLNHWLTPNSYWVLFIGRLAAFPLLEYLAYRRLRKRYLEVQRAVAKGWLPFACVSTVFYLLLLMASLYPTEIIGRPDDIPTLILLLVLMPLMYLNIFQVLTRQQSLAEAEEEKRILHLQSAMMQQRIEQILQTEQQLAIQRHDLRHRFQTLDAMLEKEEIQAAREYIASSEETLAETRVKRWCLNPVLDAVFTSYFRQAEAEHIRIEADMDILLELHVDTVDLSTVFANALENAIRAVKQLPEEERVIRCKCIRYPQLMFRVSNPYAGEICFDGNGRPTAGGADHGIGTRSIAAYCEKHGAFCDYKAEGGWFTILIIQP